MSAVRGWRPSRRGLAAAGGGSLLVAGIVTALLLNSGGSGALASPAPPAAPAGSTATRTTKTTAAPTRAVATTRAANPRPLKVATPAPTATTQRAVPARSRMTREQAVAQAEAALRAFLAVSDKVYVSADEDAPGVARFASPAVVGEVKGAAADLAAQLFHQRGAVGVAAITVRRAQVEPPESVSLDACLDLRKIDIVDSSGTVVRAGKNNPTGVLNHYDLRNTTAGWVVTAHSLPDSTTC